MKSFIREFLIIMQAGIDLYVDDPVDTDHGGRHAKADAKCRDKVDLSWVPNTDRFSFLVQILHDYRIV